MIIPIPIGIQYVHVAQGRFLKVVSCAHCQEQYAYFLELETTGVEHDPLFLGGEWSAKRAEAQAQWNLQEKGRNIVVPVPCPSCGSYQADMAQSLKEEASINSLQVAGVAITLLSPIPLAFGVSFWLLTMVMAVVGLAVLARGYVVAFRFDPNAGDPEPRKALGRWHALWGDQLRQLLASSPPAELDTAAE